MESAHLIILACCISATVFFFEDGRNTGLVTLNFFCGKYILVNAELIKIR